RELLATNAKLADLLVPLNDAIVRAWNSVPGDNVSGSAAGFGDAVWLRKPQPYIEPHLGQLKPDQLPMESSEASVLARHKSGAVDRTTRFEWLTDDSNVRNSITDETQQQTAEAEFLKMFERSKHLRRICIAEDANAGKTVLSKRLAAFAAGVTAREQLFGGQPPLILRWENGPVGESRPWPTEVPDSDALLNLITNFLINQGIDKRRGAEFTETLLQQGRVVLILDSLDQCDHELPAILQRLAEDLFAKVWVIVTGRVFSFSQAPTDRLFAAGCWGQFTILGFTENQQTRYLRADAIRRNVTTGNVTTEFGPLMPNQPLQKFFVDYDAIRELLSVAGMLAMVRGIGVLEQQAQTIARHLTYPADRIEIRIERLKTRCDFYLEFFNRQMLAAAEKNPGLNVEDQQDRWQLMLAATAFRMVLGRATNYTVQGTERDEVRMDVKRYCGAFPDGYDITDDNWSDLREFSALSDHSILEGASGRVLSFRHKGWMEFFAGWFLAKYVDENCLPAFDFENIRPAVDVNENAQPGFQSLKLANYKTKKKPLFSGQLKRKSASRLFDDVLLQLTNDPQWYWMWRFATEMPRYQPKDSPIPKGPVHKGRLGRSLSCLLLQPAREIRQNELAWRAFYLFEQDDRTEEDLRRYHDLVPADVRSEALRKFREPGLQVVEQIQKLTKQWDRAPVRDTADYLQWLADWQAQDSRTKSLTFLSCPPSAWLRTDPQANVHRMGSERYYDEHPSHWVQVQPFRSQATPVTRWLYDVFDPAFKTSQTADGWGGVIATTLTEYASPHPEDDQTTVDNYPVIMTTWYDAVMLSKFLGPNFAIPTECQHEALIRGGSTGDYCFGDDPNDNRLSQYGWWAENSDGRTHPVGVLKPNGFGLFDVHGQVWERSHDWFKPNRYEQRVSTAPVARHGDTGEAIYEEGPLPASGSSGVLRGSSFVDVYDRDYARAAYRLYDTPGNRNYDFGMRLVYCERVVCRSSTASG
ncbi:MAG: SUMF1/EgtB/PvdO family nonheme iron enzyme, partial [Planctomycetaceae bacterium]|nr:SUMF1/EgtB/PvdO family nonheme iron enzyme [Planctomycetaceae bacterium]